MQQHNTHNWKVNERTTYGQMNKSDSKQRKNQLLNIHRGFQSETIYTADNSNAYYLSNLQPHIETPETMQCFAIKYAMIFELFCFFFLISLILLKFSFGFLDVRSIFFLAFSSLLISLFLANATI